jgi:hypothetical protein
MDTQSAFQVLSRSLLSEHPSLKHEWRMVPSTVWGNRLDLVCGGGSGSQVWVTVYKDSVAVGAGEQHRDFANTKGRVSPEALASEAFSYFKQLLLDNGLLK